MIGFMNLCGGDGLSSVNGYHNKDDFLANIVVQSLHCNVRIKLFNTDQLYFIYWKCTVQSFFGLTRYKEVA